MKNLMSAKKVTLVLLIIYLIALYWIIVLKFNIPLNKAEGERLINFIPYGESLVLNGEVSHAEISMNVLIFIPLGLYIGVLLKRWKPWKKVLLFFSVSLVCETFQYIFRLGTFDVTDLINNTLGGVLGLLMYLGIDKAFKISGRAQKFINILTLAGTVFILAFLFFIKMKRLWIFRM